MKHAAQQQSSSDDDNNDDGGNDQDQDDEESYRHHQELIPPFLPDQKVFTYYMEQPNQQQQQQQQQKDTKDAPTKIEKYFEAVVRQVRHHPNMTTNTAGTGSNDSSWSFLIHFKGWNARHDRWSTASQLLPDTPEHRQRYEKQQQEEEVLRQAEKEAQKQEQLRKQQRKKEQQLAKAAASTAAAATAAEEEDLAVSLPFTLKTIMVEEWEKINRRGYDAPYGYDKEMTQEQQDSNAVKPKVPPRSVHALPAAVTIRQLLKHFEKKTRKKWQQKQQPKGVEAEETSDNNTNNNNAQQEANNNNAAMKQEIRQFCKQLGRIFETALPVCLLYPQERPQYEYYIERPKQQQRQDGDVSVVSPLDIYGCEFLLRLLVRLPQLLSTASPPLLADLVVLLQQNRPACFKGKYRPPTYPHEWLDWEKRYFGNPIEGKQKATSDSTPKQQLDAAAKEENENDASSDEDLFS